MTAGGGAHDAPPAASFTQILQKLYLDSMEFPRKWAYNDTKQQTIRVSCLEEMVWQN